jgi:uncharacterized membrane protein YkvA (DUF1232 family)
VPYWSLLGFGFKHRTDATRVSRVLRVLTWKQRASLLTGMARDPRLPKRVKLAIALLAAYVASPVDLVPDFIPVVGRLDDLVVIRFTLRFISRSLPPGLFDEHVQRVMGESPDPKSTP